ncbi:MAG: VanZ family protein [Chitinophagaceae bacterium]
MKKFQPSFVPAITWFIISTVLLVMPGSDIPKENFFTKIHFDKWVHFIMFFIMVLLWCWALTGKQFNNINLRKSFFIVALIWLGYGIGMEFVQRYCTYNRSFDGGDIIADGVGCAAGLFYSWKRYIKN